MVRTRRVFAETVTYIDVVCMYTSPLVPRLTFVWILLAVAIHDLHFRNADVKFLNPLIKFAAGLSPHP